LFLASPEVVFQELKKLSATKSNLLGRDGGLETVLVKRNQPLINLGLASYGANKDVVAGLYKHALEAPKNEADAKYKEGIRIACLSNTTVAEVGILFHFPQEVIGPEETWRVLNRGTDAEITALIRNPSIDENLLEALYQRTDGFAQMPEERWRRLVSLSSKNERIVTQEDHYEGPDMGFYSIQKAIFRLLEIAPVSMEWVWVLNDLLGTLLPVQVANPEKIDHVLTRWAALNDRHSDGTAIESYNTSLSAKEEFRCLIAALYGAGHGNPRARDVAVRCAYYGKGAITAREVRAGLKRDKDVFVFAVLFNPRIYNHPELRKPLQEEFWCGMFERYSYLKREKERRRKQRSEAILGPENELASEQDDAELASHQSGVQKAFGLVGYAWQIGLNLLYLAIIVFVLSRTSQLDPKLTIVMATLGLIYVAIQSHGISQAMSFASSILGISKSLDELKGRGGKRLDTPEGYAIAEAQLKRLQPRLYIQSLFLFLTSLICLYALYTALTGY
jgi:hypothetical protein